MSSGRAPTWVGWLQWSPMLIVLVGALFVIRGYTVQDDAILIHRLLWVTRLPLAGLTGASFEPDAMRRSIRTLGNGGLFSFTGMYHNRQLGAYRAFVTDLHRTVVLRLGKKTVVVSPATPDEFVRELLALPAIHSSRMP